MTAVLLGVFAALCWALHDQIARLTAARIGPFRSGLWIMILSALILAPWMLWSGSVWTAPRDGLLLALALGVAYAFGVAGIFKAFSLGPISIVAPLTATYPVLTVFWALAQGARPSALHWLGVALAAAGAAVVGRLGPADGGLNAVKPENVRPLLFWCAVCCLGYAVGVVIGQKAGPIIGDLEATWVSRFPAALMLIPFIAGEAKTAPLKPKHWLGLAAMAVLDILGITAINMSGSYPGAEFAAMGISAYAAIGVLLAAALLKERVSAGQWAGIGLIVAGVALLGLPE